MLALDQGLTVSAVRLDGHQLVRGPLADPSREQRETSEAASPKLYSASAISTSDPETMPPMTCAAVRRT